MVRAAWLLGLAPLLVAAKPASPIEEYEDNLRRGGSYAPGELLVEADPNLDDVELEELAGKVGCALDHRFGRSSYFLLRCPEEASLERYLRAFARLERIRWVEASWYDDALEAVPDDLAELQWYHLNQGQTVDGRAGTPGADMSSTEAWDVVTGDERYVVAILDVGVYLDHDQLTANRWQNPGETCGNGIDDDGNGYVDDCVGWDIGGDDNDPSPLTLPEVRSDGSNCLRWHATFIAGLAAAQGNDGVALAGTAWDLSIMSLKRHRDSSCRSTTSRSVEAVTYAAANGADAIGMSFNSSSRSSSLEAALQAADAGGVISVMSGGNTGADTTNVTRYPNDYALQNGIVVGSSTNLDTLWAGSGYSASKVHLVAPGDFVVSTGVDAPDSYGVGTGTSMSVGFVLGAVGLVKQAFPSLSASEVRQAILTGVDRKPAFDCASTSRCVASGGRLDLFGALRAASDGIPAALALEDLSVTPPGWQPVGAKLTLGGRLANTGTGPAHAVRLELSGPDDLDLPSPVTLGRVEPGARIDLPALELGVSDRCRATHTVTLGVRAVDAFGRASDAQLELMLECAGGAPDAGSSVDADPDVDLGTLDAGSQLDAETRVADAALTEPDPIVQEDGCRGVATGASSAWVLLVALFAYRGRRRRRA